jgi:hypothetical protein
MSFIDSRLATEKTVNGSLVQGIATMTSSTTSGAIAHGLSAVSNVSLQLMSAATTGYHYVNNTAATLKAGSDVVIVATTGSVLLYSISGR